jgi:integrase
VADWIGYLREELGFGPDDPLFPATRSGIAENGTLAPIGLTRECWATASPIRAILKAAFHAAGLPYFNPHSFRKTLVRLGMEVCRGSAEAFKAWSQNLGHDEVLTTFSSYGNIPAHRQRDLICSVTRTSDQDRHALEIGRAALAAAKVAG